MPVQIDGAGMDAISEALPPVGRAALVVSRGADAGDTYPLTETVLVLGRDPASDVFLSDVTVSRRHCEVRPAAGGYEVRDLESLNGTYLNGTRVDTAALRHGDTLQVGKFKLRFLSAG